MKSNKYLAIVGAVVLGIAGLAFAQGRAGNSKGFDRSAMFHHMSAYMNSPAMARICGSYMANYADTGTAAKTPDGVKKDAAKAKTSVRPEDPKKNPWVKSRDWNYIANSGS